MISLLNKKIDFFSKDNLILLLFSLSIFFSHLKFFSIEFRFIYLVTFFLLIWDYFFVKKISNRIIFISFLISAIIFFHSIINYFHFYSEIEFNEFFRNSSNQKFYTQFNNLETKKFLTKIFFQTSVIYLSIILIYYYKNLLIQNISKIIDNFVFIFISAILIYNFKYNGIVIDNFLGCDLGFFYNTRFLFTETSHFSIIAAPIVVFFIYNIKTYIKKKIHLVFYILFVIFSLGTTSLTSFISIISSILIVLIVGKNLNRVSIILYGILICLVFVLSFYDKTTSLSDKFLQKEKFKLNKMGACISRAEEMNNKYNLNIKGTLYQGHIVPIKDRFKQALINKDFKNMSSGIYIYSLYVSKYSLLEHPFGIGINNYKNFRESFDNKQAVDWTSNVAGVMSFKEKFMPNIDGIVIHFNKNSGSINISKIITEFSFFAILILLLIFCYSFSSKIPDEIKVFLLPLLFIQLFIRGTGYFNSGFLISLILVLIIIFNNLSRKKNEQ